MDYATSRHLDYQQLIKLVGEHEMFVTVPFNTADLETAGIENLSRGDVVEMQGRLWEVRGRKDTVDAKFKRLTALILSPYIAPSWA